MGQIGADGQGQEREEADAGKPEPGSRRRGPRGRLTVKLHRDDCVLLLIDFQQRLMPVIKDGDAVIARAVLLSRAARRLQVPVLATEQYPRGLGATVPALEGAASRTIVKLSFDAMAEEALPGALDAGRGTIVVAGCEAHVCVLQTVLGLRAAGRRVAVVSDAVGSRHPPDKWAAMSRMAAAGAETVTAEMVVFEWLARADDPAFRELLALVR